MIPVMPETIKIAQFGIGPIGLESLKLAAAKPWAQVVGAVDIDPAKIGRDLGELTQVDALRGCFVHKSIEELAAKAKPEVVLHTAVSRFRDALPQLEGLARLGVSVVSSCEELLYPPLKEPALARQLDETCRASGARVVAAGVNPGFVMDVLPLCLTGVSREVRSIRVERVVNASTRRAPLQKKIGSGLAPAQFERLFREGKAGHAGLRESAALICHCLGWPTTDITETGEAIVADHDIRTQFLEVKSGLACGLHQRAEARRNGQVLVTLDLKMYLDALGPHDAIRIEGDPPLDVLLRGGVAGDQATVAALVNTAARILRAEAGLRLPSELPLPCRG
jgi:4-hydroxy-tetrahydrodipicolinate reductase